MFPLEKKPKKTFLQKGRWVTSEKDFPIVCGRCGKPASVPFKPIPGKSMFCIECLKFIKSRPFS